MQMNNNSNNSKSKIKRYFSLYSLINEIINKSKIKDTEIVNKLKKPTVKIVGYRIEANLKKQSKNLSQGNQNGPQPCSITKDAVEIIR